MLASKDPTEVQSLVTNLSVAAALEREGRNLKCFCAGIH